MINNKKQYNQGIGKYKILSSTAGVGSIVPTTWGGFVMPFSIDNWPMISTFMINLINNPNDSLEQLAERSTCVLVNDPRFVVYLQRIQQLPNLRALIAIPHLNLTENNYCDYKSHPLFKKWEQRNPKGRDESDYSYIGRGGITLTIPAIVFPRWFRSSSGERKLMPIERWYDQWKNDTGLNNDYWFVPPVEARRDENGELIRRRANNEVPRGFLLEQVQMVLICPNGHISDIPWDKYFALKLAAKARGERLAADGYAELFNVNACTCQNNQSHQLQWLPNRNNPESYGTLKCSTCGGTVSLEGIMNIRPSCQGEKPWAGRGHQAEECNQNMRWALVTSNSVYYADTFSSLYIPNDLLEEQLDDRGREILLTLQENHINWRDNGGQGDFFETYLFPPIVNDEANDLLERDLKPEEINSIINFLNEGVNLPAEIRPVGNLLRRKIDDNIGNSIKILCIRNLGGDITDQAAALVLTKFERGGEEEMTPEKYRYDEFKVFMDISTHDSSYLSFKDVDLGQMQEIGGYFSKIKQFSNLAVSTTQLQFTRASGDNLDDEQQGGNNGRQMIFDNGRNEITALPANQNMGEGLFFSLNKDRIDKYIQEIGDRYANLAPGDLGRDLLNQMNQYGAAKFYLLHTFAHVIMKELEFTCGYPTSSLQERLYYSDRMCGVLIYTTDGSEGSMGGLVAQGVPTSIEKIISKALERTLDCSSDPLCWENRDQLNLAACFSCSMVSETSCEHFNSGLDRRALVDENFGFFKDYLFPQQ